jgi:hypothetical protein
LDCAGDENRVDRADDFAGEAFEAAVFVCWVDSGLTGLGRPPDEYVDGAEGEALQATGAKVEVNRHSRAVDAMDG